MNKESINQHSVLSTQHSALKRVLVRVPNWIGDAVMCEPALSALRTLFPQAELTMLAKPAIAELLTGHPAVSHILIYEDRGRHAGLTGKWRLAQTLRRLRFDLAILFQNAFEAALLAFLAGIPRRYGYATDGRRLLLSDPVPRPGRTALPHQVQYYLDMLRPLGWEGNASTPRLLLSLEEQQAMANRLVESGIGGSDLLIGLNPGSTYGGAKRWLPERFAETADRLAAQYGAKLLIVGAHGEETLGCAIAGRIKATTVVLSGRTSIRELMAAVKRCAVFVTNDTGPMHIAAAFGVPLVAVFGPTDWRTTAPFGTGHALVRQPVDCAPCLLRECPIDHRCMTRVTTDQVYEAAVKQLTIAQHSVPSTQHLALQGVTIFLDRDGTTNRDTGYIKMPEELQIFPGAVEAVARLKRAGARVVVITNQSGVGRGLFSLEALGAIHAKLRAVFDAGGAPFDGLYYCPHHPDDGCACRKPGTVMVERAVAELGVELSRAYVIGDQRRDVDLARRIGGRSVLVTTGPTSAQALEELRQEGAAPDCVATDLSHAVTWIFGDVEKAADGTSSQRSLQFGA
ncbi:MAG: lipopolysaccharide heptosyltransferase II [Nitrospiraceae bacterium]